MTAFERFRTDANFRSVALGMYRLITQEDGFSKSNAADALMVAEYLKDGAGLGENQEKGQFDCPKLLLKMYDANGYANS